MRKIGILLFLGMVFNQVFAQQTFKANDTIPVFNSNTSTGGIYVFDSILSHPSVIICWATWNEPSLQLLETLNEVYAELNPIKRGVQQQQFHVIDFSIDTNKDLYTVFFAQHKVFWQTHLIDFNGWESDVTTVLKLQKIPTIFIVDTNRKVLAVDVDIKQLKSTLSNIITNKGLSN